MLNTAVDIEFPVGHQRNPVPAKDYGEDSPEYQRFLGIFADALGCSGAPTMRDVINKAERLRDMDRGK